MTDDEPARWAEYWNEMERLCTGLKRQQTVTRKTTGLSFDV